MRHDRIYDLGARTDENYLREIFSDILLSIVTKKYGTSLNDYQREEKADEIIQELHDKNTFTVEMTQALIDKKGFNTFIPPISGVHLCMLSLKRECSTR